jgi:hypothetical protein
LGRREYLLAYYDAVSSFVNLSTWSQTFLSGNIYQREGEMERTAGAKLPGEKEKES